MDISIIHLTDIHFSIKTDLTSKIDAFCKAFHKDIRGITHVYFIISGDISFSGKLEEFEKARSFLSTVKVLTEGQFPGIKLQFIFVPGNHDCDFSKETQMRKVMIPQISYQYLGSDNSIIDACLVVQENFWNFYKIYQKTPEDKLYYQVSDTIDGKTITFHCINTAWTSQLKENPGSLFFPSAKYVERKNDSSFLNFGVWHHPYNWLTPNTPENNKKEFEKFTEHLASTHFFGHEHEMAYYSSENKIIGNKINLLSGEVFHEDGKKYLSGFQTVIINIETKKGVLRTFSWRQDMYSEQNNIEINLARESSQSFKQNNAFTNNLEEVKIPLTIDGRKELRQSEIFVWPDLDPANSDLSFDSYINSKNLLQDQYQNCVIDGESQIGKTTLLSMLYMQFLEDGKTPILLQGKDIKEPNLERIAKRSFRQQYIDSFQEWDKFNQLDWKLKILLIDDFQETGFNTITTKAFLEEASKMFGKVIIVMDAASKIIPSNRAEFLDVNFYTIKPLGFKKRNELIEKYQLLKENPLTMNEQEFIERVKFNFDNVQGILGDKLMPSFPLYILSILQALEYKPLQNETSFGYCYQTLIHYSLHKAGVENDDIDAYFNFLTELAYDFVIDDRESKLIIDVSKFYVTYSEKYVCPSYDKIIKSLKKAKILHEDDGYYKFGYNYILYYLSAKRIADNIHTTEGKLIIEQLFTDLHKEKNANILVFITHHSKDISFIEHCMLNSMMVLEQNHPITLERHDPFYNEIASFAEGLKEEILEINRNPREERDRLLLDQDRQEDSNQSNSVSIEDEFNEAQAITRPFQQAYRSIEIVGQIIKNRKGSLPRPQLVEMITELYTAGFRTISYVSNLLASGKTEIKDLINSETKGSENGSEILQHINKFTQLISLETCLAVFTKISRSAGNKELKMQYKEVAKKLGTPAAKLVTFGINSYYGTVTPEEVKELTDDFKNNQVALSLLRWRVKSYVYHKNPDYRIKQKFASLLNMEIGGARKTLPS